MDSVQYNKNYIVYRASAGSGKTYNLALEYVYLCLKSKDKLLYTHIMAITFTNKAVGEMKRRILDFFSALSSLSDEELLNNLLEKFQKDNITISTQEIQNRSKQILQNIYHDYNNFCVCTIDSLFQRIARSFSLEMQLPANASIELNSKTIINNIVDILLQRIGKDKDVTAILSDFIQKRLEENATWNIESNLKNIAVNIFSEQAIGPLNMLKQFNSDDFQAISHKIRQQLKAYKKQIKEIGTRLLALISDNKIECKDFKGGTKSGIGKLIVELNNAEDIQEDYVTKLTIPIKHAQENTLYAKSLTPDKQNLINNIAPDIIILVQEVYNIAQLTYTLSLIYKNFHSVALLHQFNAIKEEIYNSRQLVHISEAAKRIGELLNQSEEYLFEHLGNKYYYFFIDEFQDTSKLQYQNLSPLLKNAVSGSIGLNTDKTGKVYFFGDEKQSIYRFRNGDISNMITLTNENSGAEIRPLNTNYRSMGRIIEFNNKYFTRFAHDNNELIQYIYQNVEQQVKPANKDKGCVSISAIKDLKKDPSMTIADANKLVAELFCNECQHKIEQAVNDGFAYNDIAILVRTAKHGMMIAKHLLKNGIHVMSSDMLYLKNNADIQFLLNLIQYVDQPQNELNKLVILYYIAQKQGLSPNEILFLAKKDITPFLTQYYPQWDINHIVSLNLYQKTEYFIHLFNMDSNSPHILTFLNFVSQFYYQRRYGRHQFMEYWQDADLKLASPNSKDAVRIITAHSSKGLEFPVVIYPKMDSNKHNKQNSMWVDIPSQLNLELPVTYIQNSKNLVNSLFTAEKEKEDTLSDMDILNLEYVVFTRAIHRLHIICRKDNEEAIDNISKYLDTDSKDMQCNDEDMYFTRYQYGELEKYTDNKKEEDKDKPVLLKVPDINSSYKLHIPYSDIHENTPEEQWGTTVHAYLAQLQYPQDKETVLRQIADSSLSAAEKEKLTAIILSVCHPDYHHIIFGDDRSVIKTEVEIWQNENQSLRLDRLILNGKSACIIDYKTGLPNHEYENQINEYAEKIAQIGYTVTGKTLLYIHKDGSIVLKSY